MKRNLITVACLICWQPLHADEDHHRHHDVHVHGSATLTVAAEGKNIVIELDSPAANIVGFEHAAQSQADEQAIETALTKFEDSARLYRLPAAAGCQRTAANIDASSLRRSSHSDDHADIRATLHYQCDSPEHLDGMDIRLFEAFPAIDRLNVQFVTGHGQGAKVLSRGNTRINLR